MALLLSLLLTFASPTPEIAPDRAASAAPDGDRIHISSLVTSDGTLADTNGIRGRISMTGWTVTFSPEGPVFAPASESGTIDPAVESDPDWNPELPSRMQRLVSTVDGSWDGRFSSPGVGGAVSEIVADGEGRVYLAGIFLSTGGLESSIIAMWDGSWNTLGTGEIDGFVFAMAVSDDGTLYAGGAFETIRGTDATALAMWDGSAWSAVGTGLDNYEFTGGLGVSNESIAALEFGPDGTLYAGGVMTSIDGVAVNNIAMYDGSTWSAMGAGLTCCEAGFGSSGVQTIEVTDDNTVWAAGKFGETNENGDFYERIAHWNGSNWSTPMHVAGPVIDIAVDGNDRIYVGGDFSHYRPNFEDGPNIPANRLLYSVDTGVSWSAFGVEPDVGVTSATGGGEVFDVEVGSDGNLYIAGQFTSVVGTEITDAAVWDGTTWTAVGGGVSGGDSELFAMAETEAGWYFGGLFNQAGDLMTVGNVALFTGTDWAPLGAGLTGLPGISGVPYSMALGPDGDLYASGFFTGGGGVAAAGAARFDGLRWHPFGEQFTQPVDEIEVTADGRIYASGRFFRPDFTQFNVAEWVEGEWVEVGELGALAFAPPQELAVASQGNVYAGGTAFQTLNGEPAPGGFANFVMWDGTEWSVVGGDADGSVRVIHAVGDDIYIGGTFDEVGGAAARGIAMWDGSAWTSFGLGFREAVQAIAVADDGTIYAGGEFISTDFQNPVDPNSGIPALRVAMWDGSAWSQVGEGFNEEVNALALDADGTLYATGTFTADGTDSTPLNYIAGFDGSAWSQLGDGMNAQGNTLMYAPGSGLYVGGELTLVDGQDAGSATPSGGIALWKPAGDVSVEQFEDVVPTTALLPPNYPNPFSRSTTIPFSVDEPGHVRITVVNSLGQHVATLVDGPVGAGTWSVEWDADSSPSGLYFTRMRIDDRTENRAMTLIR